MSKSSLENRGFTSSNRSIVNAIKSITSSCRSISHSNKSINTNKTRSPSEKEITTLSTTSMTQSVDVYDALDLDNLVLNIDLETNVRKRSSREHKRRSLLRETIDEDKDLEEYENDYQKMLRLCVLKVRSCTRLIE